MRLLYLLTLVSIAFTSCSAPKTATKSAAKPSASIVSRTGERSLAVLPVSQIQIPIKLYMKPLLRQMDSMMAKEFTSEKWPDYLQTSCDFRYKYRFLRSPVTFTCINNNINLSFQGS